MFCFPVSKLPKTLNSQRKNDEKLAELNRNRNFHFYFPTVQENYEIKVDDPAWPEKLPISKRLEIKQKEEVTLTYKGKPFPAVYIVSTFDKDCVATSTEIGKRLQRAVEEENLEDLSFSSVRENVSQKLRATSTQSSNNLNVCSKEKKRKTAEPEVTEVDREASTVLVETEEDSDEGEDTTLDAVNTGETSVVVEAIDNVNETLKDVVKVLQAFRRQSRSLRIIAQFSAQELPEVDAGNHGADCEEVKVGDVILNSGPGKTPSKYARFLAQRLFSPEELSEGSTHPQRTVSKPPLERQRADKLKKLCEARFPGQWSEGKLAVDECCRDAKKALKRKLEKQENVLGENQLNNSENRE